MFHLFRQKSLKLLAVPLLVLTLLIANLGVAFAATAVPGKVYVQTNQISGNAIAIFDRSA